MAATSNHEITAPSTSSSSPPISWDVFLSFYGEDTRKNFTSHLYSALDQAGILTFRDDPALEKGQEISSGLLDAIKYSKMFILVISENYARSPWCLKELLDILSCKKTESRVVPVFYYVDPSDLRYQKGRFSDALDYHYEKKRHCPDMIDKWKSALAQISELSGYHLKKHANENESETIQDIVKYVERQVSTKGVHLGEVLFGIDSVVEEIYRKLRMKSNDVRAIGICGMGGIGKTTTAQAFYNKYHTDFDSCCFVGNVKQYSQGGSPLLPLLQKMLPALLRRKDYKVPDVHIGIRQLKQILCFKKALVVLDNLDQSSYTEFLARHCNLFSAGSRIVITTRDVHLLNQLKIVLICVDIYMVNKLGEVDSLELFNYHAFGKVKPPASLSELSLGFVNYARGLPLALKVLGSSLHGRTQDELFWKAKLEKVRKIPENKILEILQLSYNELDDETVKSIYLDIAFFFVGKNKYDANLVFKSCDYFPEVGIQILLDRCLITIDENNIFQMHDLIQDMGREISKSTRLFLEGNAWEYLQNQNQEESDKIEGLVLDLTQSTEKQINSQIFERLPKLRLLEIRNAHGIKGHFKNSFQELRCIYWSCCTWTRLPSSFEPQKLIFIRMPYNNFKMLWDGARSFTSLEMIDVQYSMHLKTTPNFENSKSLRKLYFRGCESLLKVHPSIRELNGLSSLNLTECIPVKNLAESLGHSSALDSLRLGYCSNLRQLPKQLGSMKFLKVLDASYTAIEELPDSITQLKELVYLKLDGCKKLRKLPEQIGNMEGLKTLRASYTAIEQLSNSFGSLINLERLNLECCKNLQNLPNSIWKLKLLRVLDLGLCSKLERLPNELEKMQCLEELDASSTAIKEVLDSIGQLSRLRVLSLSYCKKLKYLPDSVWNLTSLTHLYLLGIDGVDLPATVNDTKLVTLHLKSNVILWLPVILSFSSLKDLTLIDGGESASSTKPFSLSKLYNLQSLAFYDCTNFGSSFPELPLNITRLYLYDHATLIHLPDLSGLKKLRQLDIYHYISLVSLPPLPSHLKSLAVNNCASLKHLSDMSMLKELSDLNFVRCGNRKSVGSFFQVINLRKLFLPFYKVEVPKIAEWFSYKSSGRTVSFDIPTLSADNNFLANSSLIPLSTKNAEREVYYAVKCIRGDKISVRSGDRIKILLRRQLYITLSGEDHHVARVPYEEVKVEMLGTHVIQRTLSTPDFSSVLNNLITSCCLVLP
ncbi:disease resistance protein RUN1-like isoform X5 [Apium graveolens]|uniref:disease resistance protein RUN1-like isoform X5 n=1 Tax=Apium graveolens TaxID=4045 RepID=UPI003D7AF9B0